MDDALPAGFTRAPDITATFTADVRDGVDPVVALFGELAEESLRSFRFTVRDHRLRWRLAGLLGFTRTVETRGTCDAHPGGYRADGTVSMVLYPVEPLRTTTAYRWCGRLLRTTTREEPTDAQS